MLTPDQKTHFATFGFIFLKQAFSSGEIDEITVEADRLWEKAREGRPFGQEGQAIARFVEQSPGLTRMVSDERVFGAVGDLLGPDFLWAGSEGKLKQRPSGDEMLPGAGFAAIPGLTGGQDIFGPYDVVPNWPPQLPSSFWFCLSVAMFLRFHLAHSAGEAWKNACAP